MMYEVLVEQAVKNTRRRTVSERVVDATEKMLSMTYGQKSMKRENVSLFQKDYYT